jgi:NAD(P)-dependent dehydrogenase (short-subunit alcohol dehydrogenase family)
MGDGAGGSVVVVSSAAGVKAEPGTGAYAASKAGVAHLARVAAKEGAALGIRVNVVAPGGVETPLWRSAAFFVEMAEQAGGEKAAFELMAKAGTPLGRFAGAEEVAALIAFLLSDAAGVTTGAVLVSDGGYSV